jgi:hypothetical protein
MEIIDPNTNETVKPKSRLQRRMHELKKPLLLAAAGTAAMVGIYKLFNHNKDALSPIYTESRQVSFWQNQIKTNPDTVTYHSPAPVSQEDKNREAAKLNGTHFVELYTKPDQYPKGSEILWGSYVDNKGVVLADVVNTVLPQPIDDKAKKEGITSQVIATENIKFRKSAKDDGFSFNHVTITTVHKGQPAETVNRYTIDK